MQNYGYIYFIPKDNPDSYGGIFSKLTGIFTKKKNLPPLAHCGIMISETEMIHAWYTVRRDKIADITPNYAGFIIRKCSCPEYNHAHAIYYACSQLGKPYDLPGLLGVCKYYLWDKYFNPNVSNKFDKQNLKWCSELVLECLKKGGCNNVKQNDNGYESPVDCADLPCMSGVCIEQRETAGKC